MIPIAKPILGEDEIKAVTAVLKSGIIAQGNKVKELNVPRAEPLKLELKKFIECIEKDEEPPITGQDGLKALEIAMLCLDKGG